MKRSMIAAVSSVAVILSLAGAARADTSGPYNATLTLPTINGGWNTPGNATGSLTVSKFNPALGDLTGVDIHILADTSTVIYVSDQFVSTARGIAKTRIQFTVQDTGLHLLSPTITIDGPAFEYPRLSPSQFVISSAISQIAGSNDLYTLPDVLSEFTGSGEISLSVTAGTTPYIYQEWEAWDGYVWAMNVTDATLTAQVTYTYTAAPEPATLSLLALGGMAVLRRRRRSR